MMYFLSLVKELSLSPCDLEYKIAPIINGNFFIFLIKKDSRGYYPAQELQYPFSRRKWPLQVLPVRLFAA